MIKKVISFLVIDTLSFPFSFSDLKMAKRKGETSDFSICPPKLYHELILLHNGIT